MAFTLGDWYTHITHLGHFYSPTTLSVSVDPFLSPESTSLFPIISLLFTFERICILGLSYWRNHLITFWDLFILLSTIVPRSKGAHLYKKNQKKMKEMGGRIFSLAVHMATQSCDM